MSQHRTERQSSRVAGRWAGGLLVLGLSMASLVWATEFREFKPIQTKMEVPEGARAVETLQPVDRATAEKAVRELAAAYNSGQLGEMLGEGFYDASRLTDNVNSFVPRDAELRVLSVQGVQTLNQYIETDPNNPNLQYQVSRVSVTASTQLEFTDQNGTYQNLPGTTEYVFKVKEPYRPGSGG